MPQRQVYTAPDPVNAEIVKDFLESHGVAAEVHGYYLWGGMGQLPVDAYPTVWVRNADDRAEARELVKQFEAGATRRGTPWLCPRCGEQLEPQFDTCWRCGAARER